MTTNLGTESKITDEMLAKAKSRLGQETPISSPWNTEITRDNIRQWVEGIGDVNPLWIDAAYAAKTRYGALTAPPSFLYTCNQGPIHRGATAGGFRGFPGIHRFWAKEEWEWFLPMKLGDQIRGTTKVKEFIEHKSSLASRSIEDVTEQAFYNQRNELIALHRMFFVNVERKTAGEKGKHKEHKAYRYTEQELAQIEAEIDKEVVRGPKPLYWDDAKVGEVVPHVVKGPFTTTEAVAFVAGWGGPFVMASEVTHRYIRAHPKANVPDRETNAPDFPERAHWDNAFAREVGAPGAYDFGGQRVAWVLHAIHNWGGDDAFIRSITAKLVKFNVLGDTQWCNAKVTGKHIEKGEHLVTLEVWCQNQRNEITLTGEAKVRLPKK